MNCAARIKRQFNSLSAAKIHAQTCAIHDNEIVNSLFVFYQLKLLLTLHSDFLQYHHLMCIIFAAISENANVHKHLTGIQLAREPFLIQRTGFKSAQTNPLVRRAHLTLYAENLQDGGVAVSGVADFRITTEVADQNDLIDGSHSKKSLSTKY